METERPWELSSEEADLLERSKKKAQAIELEYQFNNDEVMHDSVGEENKKMTLGGLKIDN